jgi:two-component system nitrogen regulation response regulator GlnG
MEQYQWEPASAARALGIPRSSVYDLINKYERLRTVEEINQEEIETSLSQNRGQIEAAAASLRVSARGLRRRMGRLGLA